MGDPTLDELGELQRQILEVVWRLGEASVGRVRDELLAAGRPELAYTTVLSVLQKLEKAGWLVHRAEGRVYHYRATRTRDEADSGTARELVRRVFGGSPLRLFQQLIEHEDLSDDDLGALRALIERKRSGEGGMP